MMDWDLGQYEQIAPQLLAVAEAVVESAAVSAADRVLDLGCGTGNAALLAARHSAHVVAIDPSPRLLGVAREAGSTAGVSARFLDGSAESIPLADSSVDLVLSVFALIFCPDPPAAAQEIDRILTSSGRLIFTAWSPVGAFAAVRREVINPALSDPAGPPPFTWHDTSTVEDLFGPLGYQVEAHTDSLLFTAPSARAYVDNTWSYNPLWFNAHARLVANGTFDAVDRDIERRLTAANESLDGFAMTSSYVRYTVRRP